MIEVSFENDIEKVLGISLKLILSMNNYVK